jgi:hypothetical protein
MQIRLEKYQLHVASPPSSHKGHVQPTTNSCAMCEFSPSDFFQRAGLLSIWRKVSTTFCLNYHRCKTKLTSDKSYRKTHLLVSRAKSWPERAVLLTLTADCIRRSTTKLQGARIQYLDSFIDPSTRKDRRTVFIFIPV